ncbi:MAG: ABC transporter permease [Xanthomonadales bacterium]|nr:ABC transporter permease [Xanthomonadales bacterium]
MTTLRLALRSLRRTPAFTITVVLTLTLGIAAASSLFAVVHGVLLAPLPYGEPERLVSVRLQTADAGLIGEPLALQQVYARHARTLDAVAFYRAGHANAWTDGEDAYADSIGAAWISASMIPLLQVPPLLGRAFNAEETVRGGPDAVILSEAEWRSRFDAAPDVVGKVLMVNSVPRQIVGVMPDRFGFPLHPAGTRIWLPAKRVDNEVVDGFYHAGVGRLAPGATVEQAQQELSSLLPRLAEDFPRLESGAATAGWLADARPTPVLRPLRQDVAGDIAPTLWMLAAAASLVLLVAWANISNLLLIRADGRQPELALRAALGAGRWRGAAQLLTESLLLCVVAGPGAFLLMDAAMHAIALWGPADLPRRSELGAGAAAVLCTVALTVVSAVGCAAVTASRHVRVPAAEVLREAGRHASTGRMRGRFRAASTVLQMAAALVVTIGSALLLNTAYRLTLVDPGFVPTDVTILRTQLPFARYDEAAAVRFYAALSERVRRMPGVQQAGLTFKVPLGSGQLLDQSLRVDRSARSLALPVNVIDDGFLASMGVPLLHGHGFEPLGHDRGRDVLISRAAANALFGNASGRAALGGTLTLDPAGPSYTVIGVVGDVHYEALSRAPGPTIYRPLVVPTDPNAELSTRRNMALVVRSKVPAEAIVGMVRAAVRDIDPTVPIYLAETMQDVLHASVAQRRLTLILMTAAAIVTLMLGAIGLYGVVAYMVALRVREFGIRLALGADPRRIAALVTSRGLLLALCGLALGFVLYAAVAPWLQAWMFGVSVGDPATILSATFCLLGIATLASWIPARRAAQVDPARALRAE